MAIIERIGDRDLSVSHSTDNLYPTISGLYRAAISFNESAEGTNLTDKLGLSGTLLVFPEFSAYQASLQHVITLGHQIDHFYDSHLVNDPKALSNFNNLYPKLLEKQYNKDNLLVKSLLGFFSQAITVEKQAHQSFKNSGTTNISYRELINSIWVRMIVSLGTRLSGGSNDPISFSHYTGVDDIYDSHKNYMDGIDTTNVPGREKSYVLFLWTMAVQQKYDSISRRRNTINKNPFIDKPNKDYTSLAIQFGVNPWVLRSTLKSIELLPHLQRLQKF